MGWIVIIVLSIAIVAGIAIKLYVSRRGGADISQAQLQEWMEQKSDLCILDVRTIREYNSGHVPGAINIGHTEISAHLDRLRPYANKDVIVYCERGVWARMAQNALVKAGFSNVYHLTGDMHGAKPGCPWIRRANKVVHFLMSLLIWKYQIDSEIVLLIRNWIKQVIDGNT